MLKSIYISNYALISELNIDFSSGFSVITGETGAGKSIILGALSLILGQRAENRYIKADAEKCIIEAVFDISSYKWLDAFFETNDLDRNDSFCTVRRELTNNGKSRAFINDTPVSLNVIRELCTRLIDIHSQHENLLISNESFQLEVVDTIAGNENLLNEYKELFLDWKRLQEELKTLKKASEIQAAELDYVRFQFQQLSEANLIEGEQEELEAEQETLEHVEEIKLEIQKAIYTLDGEAAILPATKEALSALLKIKSYVSDGEQWIDRMHSVYVELKDICSELTSYEERLEYNPERLMWVQTRLSELFSLQKKYRVNTVDELIEIRERLSKQLIRIDSYDEELVQLQIQIDKSLELLKKQALDLTQSRKAVATRIEQHLIDSLTQLGMPNIRFELSFLLTDFTDRGCDEVQFMFSANKNRTLQPVAQIASGGEVSRLMLSIKSLIANKADLPTIIFDEIDTGVSGEIAHRMGEIMQLMAKGMQVITITHLPQIAAKGSRQYKVYKDDSGEQTQTHIKCLTYEERIEELAHMLSGKSITEAALLNAKEMLL